MLENNPFEIFEFKHTESEIYKLLIQLSKTVGTDKSNDYKKIKVADLVDISKYSKPIVYKVIKKLARKDLVQIDNSRPMFITPINPKTAIKNIISSKKSILDNAGTELIDILDNLEEISDYHLSKTPPISFFDGVDKYFKRTRNLLEQAEKHILLICGFLVEKEELMLRDYMGEKLKAGVKINLIYGGSVYDLQEKEGKKFKDYFEEHIIKPNESNIENAGKNCSIDGAFVAPPLRITLVDDSDLIMVLKEFEKDEKRRDITKISSFQSNNRDLVHFINQTYTLLKVFFMEKFKAIKMSEQLKLYEKGNDDKK